VCVCGHGFVYVYIIRLLRSSSGFEVRAKKAH